jgi:hypothetical protein
MLFLQSSELTLPHPFTFRRVSPPFWFRRGRAHSLAGEGVGGPNFDEGTYTVVLHVYTRCVRKQMRRAK